MTTPDERGQVTVLVVGMLLALLAVAGLVFDGGSILAAHRRADDEAAGAARAAAQAVSRGDLVTGGAVVLDVPAARAAAATYLAQTGHTGSVDIEADRVHVTVTFRQPVEILGLVGIGPVTVHGQAAAHPVRGVASADAAAGGN